MMITKPFYRARPGAVAARSTDHKPFLTFCALNKSLCHGLTLTLRSILSFSYKIWWRNRFVCTRLPCYGKLKICFHFEHHHISFVCGCFHAFRVLLNNTQVSPSPGSTNNIRQSRVTNTYHLLNVIKSVKTKSNINFVFDQLQDQVFNFQFQARQV